MLPLERKFEFALALAARTLASTVLSFSRLVRFLAMVLTRLAARTAFSCCALSCLRTRSDCLRAAFCARCAFSRRTRRRRSRFLAVIAFFMAACLRACDSLLLVALLRARGADADDDDDRVLLAERPLDAARLLPEELLALLDFDAADFAAGFFFAERERPEADPVRVARPRTAAAKANAGATIAAAAAGLGAATRAALCSVDSDRAAPAAAAILTAAAAMRSAAARRAEADRLSIERGRGEG